MKINEFEYFISLLAHLAYYGVVGYFAIAIWIDSGSFGAGIVGLFFGWVFYPVICKMFPLR